MVTAAPRRASSSATSRPRPEVPPVTTHAVDVNRGEAAVLVEAAHSQRRVLFDVPLADLDETSVRREDVPAAPQRLAGQAVEDDVHALAVGEAQDLIGEVQGSRVEHVPNPLRAQVGTLLLVAGSGEDLGSDHARHGDRRLANTARGEVDEHLVTLLQPADVDQAVVRGDHVDEHRRLGWRERTRARADQVGLDGEA